MWILIIIIILICVVGIDEIVRYLSYLGVILLCTIIILIAARIHHHISEKERSEYQLSQRKSSSTPKQSSSRSYSSGPVKTVNKIFSSPTYTVLINDSPFRDNLNYKRYKYKAVYEQTHRSRTDTLEAFTESEARDQIVASGFIEPIELEQIPFDPPTVDQAEACIKHGTAIPYKACKEDMTCIISKDIERDYIPNPELVQYATEMHIKLSYYIGKKALYRGIFKCLDPRDKIAFFIFCIYRYLADDRCGNLNKSFRKEYFYRFADQKIDDKRFIQSMERYSGDDLRYFGTHYSNGRELVGGSTRTIAYNEAVAFLREMHFIQ